MPERSGQNETTKNNASFFFLYNETGETKTKLKKRRMRGRKRARISRYDRRCKLVQIINANRKATPMGVTALKYKTGGKIKGRRKRK